MKLYAVRTIEDKRPVGFFAVYDFQGLLLAVDDHIDVEECECKAIREECAIVWRHPVDWQMGIELETEDPHVAAAFEEQVKQKLTFDGAFDDFLGFETIKRWRRLIRPPEVD